MNKKFQRFFLLIISFLLGSLTVIDAQSTKKERNLITSGNKLYNDGRFKEAIIKYREALQENPSSAVGKYNLGLSQIRIGSNPSDTTEAARQMLQQGCASLEQVAKMGSTKPDLAAKANYNLGNVAFNSEQYQQALGYYKQALRLNPEDEAARRNLRITQLKLQNQDNDQDQDQQNQDQQKDDKDEDKNDSPQDNQQDNQQEQQQEQQQNPQDINQQTAEQILNAMENKENQTRARIGNNQGEKSSQINRNKKNW